MDSMRMAGLLFSTGKNECKRGTLSRGGGILITKNRSWLRVRMGGFRETGNRPIKIIQGIFIRNLPSQIVIKQRSFHWLKQNHYGEELKSYDRRDTFKKRRFCNFGVFNR
jgi:hypothetical protein